jgi:hypothetical protein
MPGWQKRGSMRNEHKSRKMSITCIYAREEILLILQNNCALQLSILCCTFGNGLAQSTN